MVLLVGRGVRCRCVFLLWKVVSYGLMEQRFVLLKYGVGIQ